MEERFSELRCKEVINICDGCRLGYPGDLVLRIPEGEAAALIVPGPPKFFGLFGKGEEYVIPWHAIRRIGDDVVLVEHQQPRRPAEPPPRRRKRW